MKSNTNEIMQNCGRLTTVIICSLLNFGVFDAGFAASVIGTSRL